jgi:hypothetical protein
MQVEAFYSKEMKSWVRMVKQADNEWCHTSGYDTREEALGLPSKVSTATEWVHPCDKEIRDDVQ